MRGEAKAGAGGARPRPRATLRSERQIGSESESELQQDPVHPITWPAKSKFLVYIAWAKTIEVSVYTWLHEVREKNGSAHSLCL